MNDLQLANNVYTFAQDKPSLHTTTVQAALVQYLIAACGMAPTTKP
jgi:hypothetical protein